MAVKRMIVIISSAIINNRRPAITTTVRRPSGWPVCRTAVEIVSWPVADIGPLLITRPVIVLWSVCNYRPLLSYWSCVCRRSVYNCRPLLCYRSGSYRALNLGRTIYGSRSRCRLPVWRLVLIGWSLFSVLGKTCLQGSCRQNSQCHCNFASLF